MFLPTPEKFTFYKYIFDRTYRDMIKNEYRLEDYPFPDERMSEWFWVLTNEDMFNYYIEVHTRRLLAVYRERDASLKYLRVFVQVSPASVGSRPNELMTAGGRGAQRMAQHALAGQKGNCLMHTVVNAHTPVEHTLLWSLVSAQPNQRPAYWTSEQQVSDTTRYLVSNIDMSLNEFGVCLEGNRG